MLVFRKKHFIIFISHSPKIPIYLQSIIVKQKQETERFEITYLSLRSYSLSVKSAKICNESKSAIGSRVRRELFRTYQLQWFLAEPSDMISKNERLTLFL